MRRVFALFAAISIAALFLAHASAATPAMYAEYVRKSERASVFYVDICMDTEVSAAVFALSYDSDMVEYREAKAEIDKASVRAVDQDGCVRAAFAADSGVSGRLIRLSFKALKTGQCSFVLRLEQGVDGRLAYLGALPQYELNVSFDKSDVVTASKSAAGKTDAEKTSASKSKSRVSSAGDTGDDPDAQAADGGSLWIGGSHEWRYILLGAGAVVLAGLLALTGYLIGKRSAAKQKSADKEEAKEAEKTEE